MGSHSVTCYLTQVNAPCLTPAMQRNGRLSWPSWLDSAPARSRTSDLSITSPTPNRCTTKTAISSLLAHRSNNSWQQLVPICACSAATITVTLSVLMLLVVRQVLASVACPIIMLRIRMTGDWTSWGQMTNQGGPWNRPLKQLCMWKRHCWYFATDQTQALIHSTWWLK